jgi:maltooligosyltrehalose trehalohydrolase
MSFPFAFRFGPQLVSENRTLFRLWAPQGRSLVIQVEGEGELPMISREAGWQEREIECGAGTRYRFRLDDTCFPDPASRMQETDVHDWSVVGGPPTYAWRCKDWRGRPWEEAVIYEVHPGLLGGFAGIREHLARLRDLGITAIELMPIADFPGARNWGYDGVLPFAPDRAYGTPDELKTLIDDAHEYGLMVFLDVVYNHFGPDGNYLGLYASQFFDPAKHTPWGAAINFSEPEVQRFFLENAIYWLAEYRFDGLRFDAVHAILDKAFLQNLAADIRSNIGNERHIHLILENDDNNADLLRAGFDAQWNDDLHHVLHVLLTGETRGYYQDYAQNSAVKLARGLEEGFVYQGEASPFREGHPRGSRTEGLKPTAFVSFLQNHDQIGNRAFGERLTLLTNPDVLTAAIALLLLSPQIPLIFMGEEAGSREPFLYFTDYRNARLAETVRSGRRQEFAKFPEFADERRRAAIPDPNAPESFARSRPQFEENDWTKLYTRLLTLRRDRIVPLLARIVPEDGQVLGDAAVLARWRTEAKQLTIACNLGHDPVAATLPDAAPIWGASTERVLSPATTLAWIESQ